MTKLFNLKETDDGSYTFFSTEFNELFHSHSGAKQEAEKKFIEPCQLYQKAKILNQITLLDICYGLGYNSAAALSAIWSINPHCKINLIALEFDPNVPYQATQNQLLDDWPDPIPSLLTTLAVEKAVKTDNVEAKLYIDDARKTIQFLQNDVKADAIFLDPFSPPKCPQLWTVEFLKCVANCLKLEGYLATYSSAAAVRIALQLAGLNIGFTRGIGRRSPGTVASFQGLVLPALSLEEKEHLKTRAAIPYRDPTLKETKNKIVEQREQEQAISSLEPSSQWKKRWKNKA
ncbi:MAG: tRNA (5-methylaminomethyl-2-thiouridine)(34)-methyltransferase MnmD [Microcystaceae cyanobacterium]